LTNGHWVSRHSTGNGSQWDYVREKEATYRKKENCEKKKKEGTKEKGARN